MSAKPTDEVAPKHILICSVKQCDKPQFERFFSNQENLMSWLLSFGANVEVLEPQDIKEKYTEIYNKQKCKNIF